MNTIELINDLSKTKKLRKEFKGVFPSDCLPKTVFKKPAFVVANTDKSNEPGTHWVAFYFPKNGKAEYFDSFGNDPINKEFIKFLQRNSTSSTSSYITNKKRLQGDFSTNCGQYCCVYLYFRCYGKSLKHFLNKFSLRNFKYNDEKVIHLYHQYFEKSKKKRENMKLQKGGRKIILQNCKARASYCTT